MNMKYEILSYGKVMEKQGRLWKNQGRSWEHQGSLFLNTKTLDNSENEKHSFQNQNIESNILTNFHNFSISENTNEDPTSPNLDKSLFGERLRPLKPDSTLVLGMKTLGIQTFLRILSSNNS